MTAIDPSARIEAGAVVGDDVTIGPFCVIGANVRLGDGCRIESHVVLSGHTTIGPRTKIRSFAALGGPPQSTHYKGGPTRLEIGADCDIRESVTMNRGTEGAGGVTTVGDRGMFMAYSHVGHDCTVGSDVVFANSATLGGHCVIGKGVVFGGLSAAHQFTRIGDYAMIAGICGVRTDIIPYGIVTGNYAELNGLNFVRMKRQNLSRERIHAIRSAYNALFKAEGVFSERVDKVAAEFAGEPIVAEIIAFIRDSRDRSLCLPGVRGET